ncbi:MAG TPA: DUF4890 domain-containing protein [Prolixibacteraceae bacterium]|nr:DUF4890 domain-containing protein [Prolixibacteraceae bacterium]
MKKIGLIVGVLVMVVSASMAQPRGGQRDFDPEEMAKRQTERLKETLDLSKDQEKKVYELNLESGKEMSKLRDQRGSGNNDGMREKMSEIRDGQNEKMKKILTDKQWVKYEKYLEERRERMREGRDRR